MERKAEIRTQLKHDLDIDEKIKEHILGWKVQTFGLIFIFFIVISAALGLYGDGIVSKKKITSQANAVGYDRFLRFQSRMPLKIEISPTTPDKTVIGFSNSYLEQFRVESIVPEPAEVAMHGEKILYTFENTGPFTVVFYLVPQHFGGVEGTLNINENIFPINHFIFP